jgi:tetratricopeptide (TPR) repeat protein
MKNMIRILSLLIILMTVNKGYSQNPLGAPFESGAEYYLKKGIIISSSDNRAAITEFNKAIELNPEYAEAYYFRGKAKCDINHYRDAISDYSKAIELDPHYAAAYYERGYAKNHLKDYYGANIDLATAKEIDPFYARNTYKDLEVQSPVLPKPPKEKRRKRSNTADH